MKSILFVLLTAIALSAAPPKAQAQTPTTASGRPVDPAAIENLNRINDDRVKRGLKPILAPGYTYVPADKRPQTQPAAAQPPVAAPATTGAASDQLNPGLVENLNRMNDERARQGQPLLTVPGYTYVPADKRSQAGDSASTGAATSTTGAAEAIAAPATLRWVELVNRPEFWPKQCTVKETMQFQAGATIKAGQKVKVDGIKPGEVELSTLDDKTQFAAAPEETDVLAVANAEYARLSPKQRAVTYDSLVHRKELWPYKVKITQTFSLGPGQRVNAGDDAIVRDVLRGKINVVSTKYWVNYDVAPPATDIMEQARKFAEDPNGAPSRMVADLEGKLVNSVTGKPDPLPANAQPRYIVFFRGSSTCSITRKFAPTLIKFDNDTKPKHPEYEIVYIMTETPENTGKFAKELGFSWRALDYDTAGKLAFAGKAIGDLLPQLIVYDRTGKVLANGIQATAPNALAQLDALLNKPVEAK